MSARAFRRCQVPEFPPFHGNWEALARFTRKLLADRRNSYHEDDDRIRVMAAIAEAWRRVEAQEDLPDWDEVQALGAFWAEMRADLEELVPRARLRAERAAARSDVDADHKQATDRIAALAECLLFYHRPPDGSASATPLIVHCHAINQATRARRTAAERLAA